MNLLLVLVAALAGGRLAQRFGYPAVLGERAAGIILRPPLLGLLESDDALLVLGKLGRTREGVVAFTQESDLSAHDKVVGPGRVSEAIATNHNTIVVAD